MNELKKGDPIAKPKVEIDEEIYLLSESIECTNKLLDDLCLRLGPYMTDKEDIDDGEEAERLTEAGRRIANLRYNNQSAIRKLNFIFNNLEI